VALLAGASGLAGAALLRLLLREADFARVLALSRRPLPLEHPRLANRILVFDELERSLKGLQCTDAFCALGAAGGPQASEARLREVDLGLVLAFARAAQAAGASRLVVISAAGADRKAPQAFQRVKGEMEEALRALAFPALHILQPGVVFGSRRGDGVGATLRLGLLSVASPLLRRSTSGLGAWSGEQLATAMLALSRSQRRGAFAYAGANLGTVAGHTGRRPP
jgi:uncharacterized protein YbjT (DUF2867 family)